MLKVRRGDHTDGNPHRAQFELFELNLFNSSFSSLSSIIEMRHSALSSNSRQVQRFEPTVSQSAVPFSPLTVRRAHANRPQDTPK